MGARVTARPQEGAHRDAVEGAGVGVAVVVGRGHGAYPIPGLVVREHLAAVSTRSHTHTSRMSLPSKVCAERDARAGKLFTPMVHDPDPMIAPAAACRPHELPVEVEPQAVGGVVGSHDAAPHAGRDAPESDDASTPSPPDAQPAPHRRARTCRYRGRYPSWSGCYQTSWRRPGASRRERGSGSRR